jgi:hypothetical protein
MTRWLSFTLVLFVAACSSGASNTDGGTDGSRPGQTCSPDGKAVMLNGHYGVQASLKVNVKVAPGCSGSSCIVDTDADSELLLLADITQSGQSATVSARPCKITIPPVALKGQPMPVALTAEKSLVQSVPAVSSTSTLDGPNTCANFSGTPITIVLGAHLASSTDPLPAFTGGTPPAKLCGGAATTACSPAPTDTGCVCDQDADGKLGGTLDAKNVPGLDDIDKLYIALRTSVTLTGQVFPGSSGGASQLRGKVLGLKLDQSILGCHRSMAAAGSPRDCNDGEVNTAAAVSPAVSQSQNGDSTFIAVPLDPSATCDTLVAQEGTLFQ